LYWRLQWGALTTSYRTVKLFHEFGARRESFGRILGELANDYPINGLR
jgi:hypothetical protein